MPTTIRTFFISDDTLRELFFNAADLPEDLALRAVSARYTPMEIV